MSMRYASNGSSALKCTDLPQFDALLAQADRFEADDKLHLRHLCNDSARCSGLVTIHRSAGGGGRKLILDYSRQRITGETMELLFDLADAMGMTERRVALRNGWHINTTEDKPVLNHLLRMPVGHPFVMRSEEPQMHSGRRSFSPEQRHPMTHFDSFASSASDGQALLQQVHQLREQVRVFSERLRSGDYKSVTGNSFVNVLCLGGGALVGPEFVAQALTADPAAASASEDRTLRFLSSIDPSDFHDATHDLDPSRTLVVVISKTFSHTEIMLSARTVQNWLVKSLVNGKTIRENNVVAKHIVAVSENQTRCRRVGIAEGNIFDYFTWMCDRYSLFSAVGILPLSLQYSYSVVGDFLDGAHAMDEHFFESPLNDNIPVLLGLLGVWNSTFLGYSCRTILPYSSALRGLSSYVQKMDMESNGKRVAHDGKPLLHLSGEIDLGTTGTTAKFTLFQLMHQGRAIPADFVGFMESPRPIDLPGEAVSNHDELMSHFFGQPDALAYGKTLVDLIQEDAPERLREHMVCPGNRPSSSILMARLDAFAIGQLLVLYEHRTTVQGFLWGLNSFDNYGLDLGGTLSKKVRSQLSVSRKTGASVQGFNISTSTLLEHYLAHGNEQKRRQAAAAEGTSNNWQ